MLNFSQYVGLHKLLLICELPRVIDNQKVTLLSSYSGTVDTISSEGLFYSLDNALGCLKRFSFVTVSFYTVAVIMFENESFYVFDPHSRNNCGMGSANGTAVLTEHSSIKM